jgi:hypothetical protein
VFNSGGTLPVLFLAITKTPPAGPDNPSSERQQHRPGCTTPAVCSDNPSLHSHNWAWQRRSAVVEGLCTEEGWPLTAFSARSTRQVTIMRGKLQKPANPATLRGRDDRGSGYHYPRLMARLNGQRVGDLVLAPGWQSYVYRHEYNT